MRATVVIACEVCGTSFGVRPYRRATARFCSRGCKSSWVATTHLNRGSKPWAAKNLDGKRGPGIRFRAGQLPWNAGASVGVSPAAASQQFPKGHRPHNEVPIGEARIRKDRFGVRRAYVKVAAKTWRSRAVVAWEAANGQAVPPGHVVHHRNEDPLDDRPDNLQCVTRAEHLAIHRLARPSEHQPGLFG